MFLNKLVVNDSMTKTHLSFITTYRCNDVTSRKNHWNITENLKILYYILQTALPSRSTFCLPCFIYIYVICRALIFCQQETQKYVLYIKSDGSLCWDERTRECGSICTCHTFSQDCHHPPVMSNIRCFKPVNLLMENVLYNIVLYVWSSLQIMLQKKQAK